MNFLSNLISSLSPSSSSSNRQEGEAATAASASGYQTPPKTPPCQSSVLKDPRPLPALDNSTFSPSRCSVHPLPPDIIGSWFTNRKPFAIVIDNVLTLEECQAWIENTEFHSETGYETALVNIGGGRQKAMLDYRKSSRCIIDDITRAQELFARIKPFLTKAVATAASASASASAADESNATNPNEEAVDEESDELIKIHDRIPYELNERFRFLRYDPGEYFAPHMDGRYDRPSNHPRDGDFSLITFQLYLNDGFVGGTTRFFHSNKQEHYDVVPKAGSVLLFEHRLEHSGEVVAEGRKYAMRTDIMFAKPESI